MKRNNIMKMKSMHTPLQVAITCAAVALFVSFSSSVCFADTSTDVLHTVVAVSPYVALPRLTTHAQPLDQEAVSALIDELKSRLGSVIEDDAVVASIGDKWAARSLAGKTKKEVLDILFSDVESVVKDRETLNEIWESWKEESAEADPETPPPTPETGTASSVPIDSPAQPVQGGHPASICLAGEKNAPDGTCVLDIKFFGQKLITLEAAKTLAAKNGWALARADEVQAAWSKKALDAFQYGMLEDGRFAVPVQIDHPPNFKAGANIGVTGGNQGFFYILAAAAARRSGANAGPGPDVIDLGEPPLSTAEMDQVMSWISVRVAALRVPFCWRQSYGNTAGEPYTCRPGLERIGLLCYPPCRPGFHHSTANLCTTDCPAGFTDIGAFCQKPGPYGRGAGYVIWQEGNCKNDNPQGCEQNGALWYPKCKAGFHAVGCCVCSPDCPAGFADTGTGCTKPIYGVGAGEGLALGTCRPGFEKDPAGALCYPTCKANFHMVGPVCWQNCPAQQSADCGAGCATKQGDCASAVANMVIAPIVAAISLATFGSEGEIVGGVAHGAQLATVTAIEAERIATVAAKLKQGYAAIKGALAAVKGNIAELVGGAENLKKIQDLAKAGGKIYTISSKITKELDLFSKEFADNFEVLTSKEIAAEIDKRFGKDAAYQLKRQWGLSHLALMLNADGFATASNVIGIASAADITGITGVVAAYMHPICENNTPFPTVHPLYNH